MDTPETKVKKKIKKWLAVNAAWWTPISDRYHIGLPDFLCIVKGDVLAIEAKSEVGVLTRRQLEEARRILDAGGHFMVARPVAAKSKNVSQLDLDRGFTFFPINQRG